MRLCDLDNSFPEYTGMTYKDASQEAERLISCGWLQSIHRLNCLAKIMNYYLLSDQAPKGAAD